MTADPTGLEVELFGLRFANPVLTASGTFNFGREYAQAFPLRRLGGVITKGTSPRPRLGNAAPRIAETPAGLLNSIGLENKGVDAYLQGELPWLREQGTRVVVNVFGDTPAEFAEVAAKLAGHADLLELNLSCPNVHGGSLPFASDPAAAAEVVARCADVTDLPLLAKLAPNSELLRVAEACEQAGASGLSAINTLLGMRIDLQTRRPVLGTGMGGLSGPAILPLAVRCIYQLRQSSSLPILGMGGVRSWRDAAELAMAGADLVAVGAATFNDPWAAPRLIQELAEGLGQLGLSWTELVGAAHRD